MSIKSRQKRKPKIVWPEYSDSFDDDLRILGTEYCWYWAYCRWVNV